MKRRGAARYPILPRFTIKDAERTLQGALKYGDKLDVLRRDKDWGSALKSQALCQRYTLENICMRMGQKFSVESAMVRRWVDAQTALDNANAAATAVRLQIHP